MYIIYTDGSTSGNGTANAKGGFGVVVYDGDLRRPEEEWTLVDAYAERIEGTTNNRMELSAIIWALEHYGATFADFFIPIVFTDSQYSLKSLTEWRERWKRKGWHRANGKEIENKDLITKYDDLVKEKQIDLRYVKGHNGNKGNEIADKLATGALDPLSLLEVKEGE